MYIVPYECIIQKVVVENLLLHLCDLPYPSSTIIFAPLLYNDVTVGNTHAQGCQTEVVGHLRGVRQKVRPDVIY